MLLLAKLQRMQFGRRSEKVQRQIERLELRLEELEANKPAASVRSAPATAAPTFGMKPVRRALPGHLPREVHKREPKETMCADCGGTLRKLGEDVSEMLEYGAIQGDALGTHHKSFFTSEGLFSSS